MDRSAWAFFICPLIGETRIGVLETVAALRRNGGEAIKIKVTSILAALIGSGDEVTWSTLNQAGNMAKVERWARLVKDLEERMSE